MWPDRDQADRAGLAVDVLLSGLSESKPAYINAVTAIGVWLV